MSDSTAAPPFEDSRRLTGANLFFDEPAVVLESALATHEGVVEAWRSRIAQARTALAWPDAPTAVRTHASGLSLAMVAPIDQLYTATEVNEWALCSALRDHGVEAGPWPDEPEVSTAKDDTQALAILKTSASVESIPALQTLALEAARRGINLLADEDALTLGSGKGGRTWLLTDVPAASDVDWDGLSDVPIVLVTGSNGKTTTTRLLAALVRAHGWCSAHTCTDGVFVGDEAIDRDDYSGPAGARLALRQPDIDAAILETARGGILRRGIAPQHADVAVVTNVSNDHFGDYGIDDLDGLADAKLTVARPLGRRGTLVINGDDALLLRHAQSIRTSLAPLALFALDADSPVLQAHREGGGATAAVRGGHLVLERGGDALDLGAIAVMPLTLAGAAKYNIANIAAAALVADALGINAETIRSALMSFGARPQDNPGRLEHHVLGGMEVFLDYAHNPDGLRSLLDAATRSRRGRLGMLLGQAGDRGDQEIRELAAVAAAARPDCVILKDLPGYLRGREDGEVAAILHGALLENGLEAAQIITELDEWKAVLRLLEWARRDDTLVLPVQGVENRPRASALLSELSRDHWSVGNPLPENSFQMTR